MSTVPGEMPSLAIEKFLAEEPPEAPRDFTVLEGGEIDLPSIPEQEQEVLPSQEIPPPVMMKVHELRVEDHMGLVRSIAVRFAGRGEELDDLFQVGAVGLLLAIERFDPARGVEFSTYATATIIGEIKKHFRDKRWLVRPPRRLGENYQRVETAEMILVQELGRFPTKKELAERTQLDESNIDECAVVHHEARHIVSLDQSAHEEGDSTLGDMLPSDVNTFEVVENTLSAKSLVRCAADVLPERAFKIMRLRFQDGLSQKEIANIMGISQMHVSRILTRSLSKLAAYA